MLLVAPGGRALVVSATELPADSGKRCTAVTEFLTSEWPPQWAVVFDDHHDIFVGTTENRIIRLSGKALRAGSKSIDELVALPGEEEYIGAVTVVDTALALGNYLATVTTGGYGKIILASEFEVSKVGARGILGQKKGKNSGNLCTIEAVDPSRHLLIGTLYGTVLRIRVGDLPPSKRENVGLKLIHLVEGDQVTCACAC